MLYSQKRRRESQIEGGEWWRMEEILQFLLKSHADESVIKNVVLPQLERIGFNSFADLVDMEYKDLDIEGLTELNRRRIWRLVKGLEKSEQTENETSDIDLENIYVRYIPCTTGLFSEDIKDHIIDHIPAKMKSMDYLVSLIEKDLNIPDDQVIELYTCEGYPMQLNYITAKATLEIWSVSDGELFYVMSHKKDQPGQKRFATLPGIDHDIGQESFTVEMPCQNNLKVNAYIGVDSPEDIGQKIYSLTGVSVPYMSLYIRRGYSYERLSSYSELEDKDVIRVVLRNPNELVNPRSVNFGSRSYNPLISHSKLGLSKFYSILKFLRSPRPLNADYDFEKLLSCILHVTNFPPLVYALRMLREQSFLTIAGWTALVEGLFALFKTIINTFATVSDETVFEYSDYLWGVLIRQSQKITDPSNVTCDQFSLLCVISGTRILKPVLIPNLGYCDESHVMAHASIDLKKVQYNPEYEVSRLLLCFPWESDKEVYKWINAPKPAIPEILKKIDPSTQLELKEKFALKELSESLEQLSILNPKGLFGGTQCLTYVNEGRLVYFMGFAKGTDEERRIYDPNSCHKEYLALWKKSTLDKIGSSEMQIKVSNDFITVWKKVIKQEEQEEISSIRTNAIIQPHDSIKWEPEEAIMVLLDRSGSMRSYIFDINNLRCIDAAKELFNAFVTRTQAYQLHHCFGLTIFDHRIEVKLQITKNPEKFETSLEGIEPEGGTALTDAIINGANQLKGYQCKKRILCLTDGFNGSSTPYSDVLQVVTSHNIIVDTVLLTGPRGNIEQKALSHASGGVCVLPLNMREALMFFEMDAMLSLHERPSIRVGQNASLTHFEDLKAYPYETKDHFKCHIANTERTLSLDSYMNKLATTPSTCNQKRRIITELKVFKQHPHADIAVFPSQQNYNKWKVVIRGPNKTAYEKGAFVLSVSFPDKYPGEPPQIRFLTPIYHCNISGTSGRICHAALSTSYTPAMRMREILCHIYGLLMCPDIDTPIDGTLADQYGYLRHHNELKQKIFFGEAANYFDEAKKWVIQNASKPFEKLCMELQGNL